jgi:predicted nucleotidyltransferase
VDVLRRALKPFDRSISLAFIFGSIARSRELSDSDIDLMMVTTEGLSSIAPALHQAEQQLSRPVNPVLYTPEEWTQKLAERHPFLQRVLDGEKLFIIGIQDDLATAA